MSIQYRKHDYFHFQNDKKMFSEHRKTSQTKLVQNQKTAVMSIKLVRIRKAST